VGHPGRALAHELQAGQLLERRLVAGHGGHVVDRQRELRVVLGVEQARRPPAGLLALVVGRLHGRVGVGAELAVELEPGLGGLARRDRGPHGLLDRGPDVLRLEDLVGLRDREEHELLRRRGLGVGLAELVVGGAGEGDRREEGEQGRRARPGETSRETSGARNATRSRSGWQTLPGGGDRPT
jgi:hypothetical protein